MTDGLKLGRRPPKNHPALMLGPLLTGIVPPHPTAVDYLGRLSNWQMLGNDNYGDCVSPETRILTADLNWVRAGDLMVGDALLAFNESAREPRTQGGKLLGRNYEQATVETADPIRRPCYDLEFSDGTIVRSSAGHRWLVGGIIGGKAQKWVETKDLKVGPTRASRVVKPLDVWAADRSFSAGYLAAAYDGEGNLDQGVAVRDGITTYANRVAFSQTENVMLAQVEQGLIDMGVSFRHGVQPRGGNSGADGATRKDIHRLTVNLRSDYLRLLGSVRPQRLLDKLAIDRLGRIGGRTVQLVRKDFVGEQDVIFLNTSSRTYIAEGLASHNCVAVMWANMRRLTTAVLSIESYPTQSMVFDLYRTQNPGFVPNPQNPVEDNGMDEQTLFEYLVKTGGPDGVKALAFAKVDTSNLAEMDAAEAIFGGLCYGINVLNANMDEFDAGKPWDYVAGSPDAGGHGVWGGGYSSLTPQNDKKIITWAKETAFTDAFVAHQMEEAWVVIWPEHLGSKAFQQGVDLAALSASFTAITGRPFPAVVPPTPVPVDADAAFAAVLRHWVTERHYGENKAVQVAAKVWLAARNL